MKNKRICGALIVMTAFSIHTGYAKNVEYVSPLPSVAYTALKPQVLLENRQIEVETRTGKKPVFLKDEEKATAKMDINDGGIKGHKQQALTVKDAHTGEVKSISVVDVLINDEVFKPAENIKEYRLAKYDRININVLGYTRADLAIEGTVTNDETPGINLTIGPDGNISLPYTGIIKLSGLSMQEATDLLNQKLSTYLTKPNVSLNILSHGPRKVYVMGEVATQGIYNLGPDYMNIFAAISSAGGIKVKGRPKHITVIRVIDGVVYKKECNMDAFVKKQDMSQNIQLLDGDMIYIPKSGKITLGDDLAPLMGPIGILIAATN